LRNGDVISFKVQDYTEGDVHGQRNGEFSRVVLVGGFA
jgi:hypothetical protein